MDLFCGMVELSDIHQVTCRSNNKIDLLFQVNNCKWEKSRTESEHSWSKTPDRVRMRMNRKEESIPSCSSNRRNSLVPVVAAVPGEIHLQ
jgi:hypothetical protein